MRDQLIEFVKLTERRAKFDFVEAFQLRKDRPHVWLQKACFFILGKLRAHYVGESVAIERHVVNGATFMERLLKQRAELEGLFNRRPARLLIGAEDYAQMMREVVSSMPFSFSAEYGHRREILGLTVEVIPWMRGILVMPERI